MHEAATGYSEAQHERVTALESGDQVYVYFLPYASTAANKRQRRERTSDNCQTQRRFACHPARCKALW